MARFDLNCKPKIFSDVRSSTSEDCLKPYIDDPGFAYQDFAKRDAPSNVPTFRAQVSLIVIKTVVVEAALSKHSCQCRVNLLH